MIRSTTRSRAASRSSAALAALALGLLGGGVARAGERDDFGARLLDRAAALLAEASAERVPPRRPPTPVPVTWKARRLGAVDLGAPLLALTAGDLDGDGRAELVAVTEAEVLLLAPEGRRALAVVARTPLPDDAAGIAPRTPVAAATIAAGGKGAELRVRASTAGKGARLAARGKGLEARGELTRYPLCGDREGELAGGRNYFERTAGDGLPAAWPSRYWAATCATGLVDREGRAMRVDAVLGGDGALGVTVSVRCSGEELAARTCTAERTLALAGAGVAIAVADVDRDGRAEVIHSAASAPGDADRVTVHTLPASGETPGKPVFSKKFSGGVGGVAADDLDGDGDVEVIAAVRLPGASRVDLWLLD